MDSHKIIAAVLTAFGATLMFYSILSGVRMSKEFPILIRDKWLVLIGIMAVFFCGHLVFAGLLATNFPFPRILIGGSIFLGGLFALLVIILSRITTRNMEERQNRLARTHRILKHKATKLTKEIVGRKKTEDELRKTSALFLKDLFEIMDEVLANRDQYTFDHAFHVAEISKQIGKELGLSDEELESLELGCLVHDVGKTAIPDDVLLKPSRFDFREKDIIKYHPLIGAKLIARHIQDDRITDVILHHHERLDGSGYPLGLKGKDIDLFSRIVAVADIYEALVTQRPYKKPLSHKKALIILREEVTKGRLDSNIVNAFMNISKSLKIHSSRKVTAGFMKNVEMFRNRTFFREPLTEFYNYRYLFYLDDAKVLHKNTLPYELILIRFPELGKVQQEIGYSVADQVLDELGQNILEVTEKAGIKREQYDSSIMIFRKGIDYLIYAECDERNPDPDVMEHIGILLKQAEKDWGLHSKVNSLYFDAGLAVEKALHQLFTATSESNHQTKKATVSTQGG